jgi:ubiquinol-cytochrome c reductase cytochrome c subunit
MTPTRPRVAGRRATRHATSAGWRAGAGLIALLGALGAMAWNSGVLALAAPSAPAAGATDPALVVTATVDEGRQLYLATCAACHGDQAQGNAAGPSLLDSGPALLDFMMRTGRMPLSQPNAPIQRSKATLNADQIAAVIAFVGSLGGSGPAIPDVATSGADLALGRSLYIANCAACHGAGGAGGAVGNGIVAPGLGPATPLDVAEAVIGGPPPMPRFGFAQPQLNAIAAYVQTLRQPPSPGGLSLAGLGPVPEGLVAGLVGLVALLVVARWIGAPTQSTHARPKPAPAMAVDNIDESAEPGPR